MSAAGRLAVQCIGISESLRLPTGNLALLVPLHLLAADRGVAPIVLLWIITVCRAGELVEVTS